MATAIVMGGGFGGMAAALRLRAKNYDVSIVDRCSRLGGRAQVFEKNGFRHDAGPTVLTAPFLFDELFELFGKNRGDYVEFVPVEPWYRFEFRDGTTFDYGGTVDDTLAEIGKINPGDRQGYLSLLDQSKKIFDIGFTELGDQPFHRFGTMMKQVPHLIRLGCYRTVWQLVSRHLKDNRLRQAFSIPPLLVGGNPFETTSIYNLIHYVERKWGIHFAMGGTGAIVDALTRLMEEEGIHVSTETSITELNLEENQIQSIRTESGDELHADLFVSNLDPAFLYRNLLPKRHLSPLAKLKTKRAKFSMGLFVLFFGTTRKYDDLAHHTIWLGERFEALLKEIFHGSSLPEDFSLYLHRPTATDPDFAPEGCDSFYVLAPVPNLQADVDWELEGPRVRDRIVKALGSTIMPGLEECITSDFYMTPENFERDYQSVHGAGFSVSPIFSQSAWFRFHNKSEGPENLYLVGAGTHPGAGLPGVLCSAKVLDRLIPTVQLKESA